ncbi:hypothetical protein [Vibrio harveyi]|uniref:hypothetical protein n=1 Tax=Vibrio harveyi TaxID=669 RepID=UPI00237EF439|nr:hypothetical protein [Vibrio harveyi]ELG4788225.1 hypothetical protein [Vibrio vulnificus]WDZ72008.1 hypothetical protein PWW31_13335 [Vibrio harveyi]HDM8069699.1 hypothetical protein [Vibrio harveyi]
MLHNFEPTIEAPESTSPIWYKNYHDSFYLCQLVNNLLLSYMKSFIELNEKAGIIATQRQELIEKGILTIDDSFGESIQYLDSERLYSIAIESFLEELIEQFKQTSDKINSSLTCMGIGAGNYYDKNVDIDLESLANSLVVQDWYEIVKGFLNVWEFMFLFSLLESTLKELLGDNVTSDLINKLDDNYPDVLMKMHDNHNLSSTLSKDIWTLYTTLRNIYSHTHGVISERNKKRVSREVKAFRRSYNNSFHSPSNPSEFILSSLMSDSGDLFNGSRFVVSKFYLIEDKELNVFRNFSSKLLHILSKELA